MANITSSQTFVGSQSPVKKNRVMTRGSDQMGNQTVSTKAGEYMQYSSNELSVSHGRSN